MARPKRPHIVKRMIRGKVRYVVDLGMVSGKRVEKFFRSRQAAEVFLGEQKEILQRHGENALRLSNDERVLFAAARDRLAAVGATY